MATISEDADNVHTYIEEKKRYEDEGWEIAYIFESRFTSKCMKGYGTRLQSLEKRLENLETQLPGKMGDFLKHYVPQKKFDTEVRAVKIIHPATKEGFVSGTIFLDDEYAKDFTKENPQQFIDQFKKIVGSKDLIGDKTLIILSKESHHLFKQTTEKSRKKSLDVASKSVKKGNSENIPTKPKTSSDNEIYVEKITRQLRGDLVKILWIPKENDEVDPNYYISIFLLNEIANVLATTQGDQKMKDVVKEGINLFPNEMWGRVIDITSYFENAHFEDDEDNEEEATGAEEPDE